MFHVLKDKFLLFAGTPAAPCVWTHPAAHIPAVKRKPFPNSGTYCLTSVELMFSLKEKKKKKIFPVPVFAKQTFHMYSKCKQMQSSVICLRLQESCSTQAAISQTILPENNNSMCLNGDSAAKGMCFKKLLLATEHMIAFHKLRFWSTVWGLLSVWTKVQTRHWVY